MNRNVALLLGVTIFWVVVIASLIKITPTTRKDPIVTVGDYGIVQSVGPCRVSKHSYSCRVTTDLDVYTDTKVSSFPGSSVTIGDRIFVEKRDYSSREETLLCKNHKCLGHGVCYWWMPCYEPTPNPEPQLKRSLL